MATVCDVHPFRSLVTACMACGAGRQPLAARAAVPNFSKPMSKDILHDARLYLGDFLKGKQKTFEVTHPWRKDWKFAVLHSLHVESYVLRILARQPHNLSELEIKLLQLAAILHDIARLEGTDHHAKLGAEIAEEWLRSRPEFLLTSTDIQRISEMIMDHSNKNVFEPDVCKAVLKDADTLDEIGAMSIFMTSNWLETRSPFFFHELRQRLIDVELPFCDKKLAILNTDGAKEILREKKAFIENFIAQITEELRAEGEIEQILLALSKNGG